MNGLLCSMCGHVVTPKEFPGLETLSYETPLGPVTVMLHTCADGGTGIVITGNEHRC